MMNGSGSRPGAVNALMAALIFQGLSAVGGGWLLVSNPSGSSLGFPLEDLSRTPFDTFLVPGLVLVFVLGLLPLAVARGLWLGRRWSWYGSLFVGVALAVWIVVEVMILGLHFRPPLQPIFGVLGFGIVILTLTRSVAVHADAPEHYHHGAASPS